MKAGKPVVRVISEERVVFGPWDNFDRHAAELTSAGAAEADLQELRKAAAAIEQAEREAAELAQKSESLPDLTAPYTTSCGWVIQPPTKAAKRWAAAAMTAMTGGSPADTPLAQAGAIIAALWVLREWGDGKKGDVSATVLRQGALAEMIFDLMDEVMGGAEGGPVGLDAMLADFSRLMGVSTAAIAEAAKKKAAEDYERTLAALRSRLGSTPA